MPVEPSPAEKVQFIWAALTATLGAGGVRRPALHLACEHVEADELRRRLMATFTLLRVMAQECAEARALSVDEYLAEKGLNLALMAERWNSSG